MSNLKSKFLFQIVVSLLHAAAPLITFPYVARVLGPENIGKINFVDYTSQLLILFASFGIPFYGIREISKARNDLEKKRKIFSELLIIHLAVTLISVVVFIVILKFSPEQFFQRQLVILASVNILINAFSLEWFVQGHEDFEFLSKRSLLSKLIMVAAVFLIVKEPGDYTVYYLILVSSGLFLIVSDAVFAARKKMKFVSKVQPLRHIKSLSIFFLTTASVSIYTFFDTFILGIVAGSLAVGFYTTALKVVRLSQNFINDLGGVLLPRISYLIQHNNKQEINRILNTSVQYVLTVSVPLAVIFYTLSPEIIRILTGTEFLPSVSTLRILSFLPLIIGFSNLFGVQILLPFGKENKMLIAVALGSILSVAFNLILAPVLQQDGAAIACISAEIMVTTMLGIFSYKLVKLSISFAFIMHVLFSSILFVPVVYAVKYFIQNDVLVFTCALIICAILYFTLQLFIFKNVIIKEMLIFFKSLFNKMIGRG